jgi:hypothetical protein
MEVGNISFLNLDLQCLAQDAAQPRMQPLSEWWHENHGSNVDLCRWATGSPANSSKARMLFETQEPAFDSIQLTVSSLEPSSDMQSLGLSSF